MRRMARCHCGALEVECEGEPRMVAVCCCEACQRRTGSSYNLGAWFPKERVTVRGRTKEYSRTGDAETTITFSFCPECGSNVCWSPTGDLSGLCSVAVGCFVDPDFPAPTIAVYGKRRHRWLAKPAGAACFLEGPGSAADEEPPA